MLHNIRAKCSKYLIIKSILKLQLSHPQEKYCHNMSNLKSVNKLIVNLQDIIP